MESKRRGKKTQQNKYTNAFDDDDEEKQKFSSLSLEVLKLNILHASLIRTLLPRSKRGKRLFVDN